MFPEDMATAEQIMSLIRSHASDDHEHFHTVALQIASYEARRGHQAFANDILNVFKQTATKSRAINVIPESLQDILIKRDTEDRLCQLVVSEDNRSRIQRILVEYLRQEILKQHGLGNRRKILLAGAPGTGKTMTAGIIANELHLPLITVQLDMILSRYMGESSAKLHQVFEFIAKNPALYLFDEFDTLGTERSSNDIGEMRRVLNTLLLRIEQDKSDSILIAATNKPEMLDKAIFRRFDACIEYALPDSEKINELVRNSLDTFITEDISVEAISSHFNHMSCADVVCACHDAVKFALLDGQKHVTQSILEQAFAERAASIKLQG